MHRNVKNLLITEVFPPRTGGSGRWFWEIYRRFPRHEVAIVAGKCPRDEAFDAGHEVSVARESLTFPNWGVLGIAKFLRYAKLFWRLKRKVRREQITAIHCGRCLPEGLLGLMLSRWFRMPYLCYVHGEELTYAEFSRELRYLMEMSLGNANCVIANSRHTESLLVEQWKLAPERVRVLHPGVDTSRFRPAERSLAVRTKLGWGDRPVVLTVGRLQARKGHDCLIRALHAVKQQVPSVLYAIVGDGEERAKLEALVSSEGLTNRVIFHGDLCDDDLIDCYQQCDLFALPNRQVGKDFEGFGMVLLEAQACGRPVVAGTSGGTAETMCVPETGRLVCCDEPQPLADVLVELLADRRQLDQMGEAARKWVCEHFDWEPLSQEAADIFGQLGQERHSIKVRQGEEVIDTPEANDVVLSLRV